jgi:hypothetical protein
VSIDIDGIDMGIIDMAGYDMDMGIIDIPGIPGIPAIPGG